MEQGSTCGIAAVTGKLGNVRTADRPPAGKAPGAVCTHYRDRVQHTERLLYGAFDVGTAWSSAQ